MASNNQTPTPGSGSTRAAGVIAAGLLGILLVTATRSVIVKSGKSPAPERAQVAAATATPTTQTSVASATATTTASEAGIVAAEPPTTTTPAARARRVTASQVTPQSVVASATPTVAADVASESVADVAAEVAPATTVNPAPVLTAPAQPPVGGIGAGRVAATPWDWRTLIAQPGVKFNATDVTDASSGTGGMAGAHSVRTYSNLELRLDFDSLVGWHGFSAYVQHKTKTGRNGSGEAAFLQNFSNIDAPDFRAFGEVWVH